MASGPPRRRRSGIPGLRPGTYTGRDGRQHQSREWVLDVKRAGTKRRRIYLGTDRAEAERAARAILADLDAKARARQARARGDPLGSARAEDTREIEHHIAEWLEAVRARGTGRSPQHLEDLERAVTRYVRHARARALSDLTRESAEAWLADLAAKGWPRPVGFKGGWPVGPASQWTLQHARLRIRQWARWLVRQGRLAADPFAGLEPYAPASDRRYIRGAYSRDQVDALLLCEALPLYRLACWHVASCTGLRRAELRRLLRTAIDLDRAIVAPPGPSTKAGRADVLVLTPEAVAALRAYWALLDSGKRSRRGGSRVPVDLARALPEGVPAVATLLRDFAKAGVPIDPRARGRRFDVHSLRVSLNVRLADAGFGVSERQAIMRHASPATTQASYYELPVESARRAAEALRPKRRKSRRRSG